MDDKVNIWEGLSDSQIEAINYKILNPTASYDEIAEELDISKGALKSWRLNQLVAKVKANTTQSILDFAERASVDAIRVLKRQMDSDDENIAHKAAKEMLDRFMGKTTQRSEVDNSGELTVNIRRKPPDRD